MSFLSMFSSYVSPPTEVEPNLNPDATTLATDASQLATDATNLATDASQLASDATSSTDESKLVSDEIDPMTIPESSHLEFVPMPDMEKNKTYKALYHLVNLVPPPPSIVMDYLKASMSIHMSQYEIDVHNTHCENAKRLAERVIHKYRKWGSRRFGQTPDKQLDFYNGEEKIDSPIKFDGDLRKFVNELAEKANLDGEKILSNLHIGRTNAKRFRNFIEINIPTCEDCGCDDCGSDSDCDSDSDDDQ